MKFSLNENQVLKLKTWQAEQNAQAVEKQKQQHEDCNLEPDGTYEMCWEAGYPYTGAIGGGNTYMFSPTSLGVCVSVLNTVTGNKIDLTEYENW